MDSHPLSSTLQTETPSKNPDKSGRNRRVRWPISQAVKTLKRPTQRLKQTVASVVVLVMGAALPASASVTECHFGGPTPGWRAVTLDLPQGSDFLGIELRGTRATRPVRDGSSWHLAQGIYVIDAETLEVIAFRIISAGSDPRRVRVIADGTTVADQAVTSPEAQLIHAEKKLVPDLPPGTYHVVAFGTDGGRALPNEWWSADLRVGGSHSCAAVGSGEVFDYSHADFEGGTQINAGPVSYADGSTFSFTSERSLVVGLLDAAVQGEGEAELDFLMPNAVTGTLEDELEPFVSTIGTHDFTARFAGPYGMVSIAGVALDLP